MAGAQSYAEALALPQRLEPMLAVAAPEPFDSPDKLFEVKWDGLRALGFVTGGQVRLQARNLLDVAGAFPEISAALKKAVHADGVVVDGELVALDKGGVPQLARVMQRLQEPGVHRVPVSFELFDILYLHHRSVLGEPLWRRKKLLNETVSSSAAINLCHFEEGCGTAFFKAVTDLGLEGMVAKDKHSFYYPGRRSRHWLKVKASRTAHLVVGGYTVGGGPRRELFGSLLLGAYDGRLLRFVGTVGGGLSGDDRKAVYANLKALHTVACPFSEPPLVQRLLYWCRPELVVQVKYGELTEGGRLRFPVFTALRPDLDARECTLAGLEGA